MICFSDYGPSMIQLWVIQILMIEFQRLVNEDVFDGCIALVIDFELQCC